MSDEAKKDQLEKTMSMGEDWDWEAVQKVWERISALHDFFRNQFIQIEWVSRGSLFAAMHAMLLECGGDIGLAKATVIDMVQVSYPYVAGQLAATMTQVWKKGEIDGQELTPPEKARLKTNLDTLTEGLGAGVSMLDEDQLQAVLAAQDFISASAEEAAKEFGPEATICAVGTMFVQAALFATGGDVMAAKAAAMETLHQVWPIAINAAQKLVGDALEGASEGPPEGRPN